MKEKKKSKLGVGIVFLSFDVLFLADLYINVAILKFDLRAREMDQPLKSAGCSCKGPELGSWHRPVTLTPEDVVPSSGHLRAYAYTLTQTHIYANENNNKSS